MNRTSVAPTRYAPGGRVTARRTRNTWSPTTVTSTSSPVRLFNSATSAWSSSSATGSRSEGPVTRDHPEPVAVLEVKDLVGEDQLSAGGIALTLQLEQIPLLA